ncbi:hypothetical protein AVEN_38017-1 [Araneus ventricosus]|uniref:Reverse transcriptase domain-containing protein n=1 Tax=Araneus ventricosus TaxID=182803 RepID=A0A4Y2M7U2_ARAVE|nr:hypothetical protein AVEN_38017-1 [Araneus ventricosus]
MWVYSQKSTEDTLIKHCNILFDGRQKKLVTTLIFLDIKGAFDNAWWPSILSILKETGIPENMLHLLKSFLSERTAGLALGPSRQTFPSEKGCPLGSVSGPILFGTS